MKIAKSELARLKEITHTPWEQDNPLSYQQFGIWFLCELVPESPVWNVLYCKRLIGEINIEHFRRACEALVVRHTALRTNVVVINGQPFQRYPEIKGEIVHFIDYSKLDKESREKKVQALIDEETSTPIKLDSERLFKIYLMKMGEAEYILLLNLHHFMSDHVSVYMLACDLKIFYNAYFEDTPPLKDLPIDHHDYVLWQRKIFARQFSDEQEQYLDQFIGQLPVIDLPSKIAPDSKRNYKAGVAKIVLDKQLISQLNTLSFHSKVITFSTCLAAYFVLLHKYSQQNDILVATLFSGRDYNKHLLPMVGYFTNTVALRMDISDDLEFEVLLQRVHEKVRDTYDMPNYPFERLVQKIKSSKRFGPTPLFQTAFNVLNFNKEPYAFHGIKEETRIETDRSATPTDLMLEIRNYSDRTEIIFLYSIDFFDKELAAHLVKHYVNILRKVAVDSRIKLSALSLLDEREKERILYQWNDTKKDFPRDQCLHELIETRAQLEPDHFAVVYEKTSLTYQQLNEQSNQVAHFLIKLGVKPDTLVGVCMERSLEMVVGLLGILKAGGAYVPVDPDYPEDRVDYMLKDSAVSVIIAQKHCLSKLSLGQQRAVCFDNPAHFAELKAYPKTNPEIKGLGLGVKNLAYMIYTSGSTGQPKGVLVEHQAIVNRLDWMQKKYPINAADNILQKTPFSFDVSVWEFFWPLLTGARITMAKPGGHKDPHYLSELIQKEHVTVLHFVPSMLTALLTAINWSECRSVRQVFCSGERLSPETVSRYFQSGTKAVLANLYGPTEAAVDVSYWDCHPKQLQVIPIGKPIHNTALYILDPFGMPVPIGVPGELHIGGICLARGYLKRPDLTAEKFIPDPFRDSPGARLYKTGDLVRFLHDGNIEYLGRLDHQVKIRGYRIELGEIETVLDLHPSIQESIVIASTNKSGDNVLVAYYVPVNGQAPTRAEMRHHLKEKLPEYMVPPIFIRLEEMPLTSNGKVNRRALPIPDTYEMEALDQFVPPRDTFELRLSHIWEDLLNLHPIGVRDNFFEMGDSLLGILLLARIEQEFGINLPLSVLFKEGTIELMANLIRQQINLPSDSPLVPMRVGGDHPALFLVHPIGGSVLCYAELAHHLKRDQPIYGLQSIGLTDGKKPLNQMEIMADRYLEEIRTVQPHGPYYVGGWSFGGSVAFRMSQKLMKLGEEVALLFLIDTYVYTNDTKPQAMDASRQMSLFLKDLGGFFGMEIPVSIDELMQREPRERLVHIMEAAQKANVLPQEIELKRLSFMFEVYQANLNVAYHYSPDAYHGRVILFTAQETTTLRKQDETLGWGALIGEGLEIHKIPGDHYTIIHKPNVQILAEKMRNSIEHIIYLEEIKKENVYV